jgi:hypothetical protein
MQQGKYSIQEGDAHLFDLIRSQLTDVAIEIVFIQLLTEDITTDVVPT